MAKRHLTPVPWTSEQVLCLSPNEQYSRSSYSLSAAPRWSNLGHSAGLIWGEILAKEPAIRTQISLHGFQADCSCKQKAYPCHHALGLALLAARQPETFADVEAPAWLKQPSADTLSRKSNSDNPAYDSLLAGLTALELWLHDLLYDGLEAIRAKPATHFTQMADRLIDARAPTLANEVRSWMMIPSQDVQWTEKLLARMGRMKLLIEGVRHLAELPADVQADLRRYLGWTTGEPDPPLRSSWIVMGRKLEQHRHRQTQTIWLWSPNLKRPALLQQPLYQPNMLDTTLLTGMQLDAEVCYYPGSVPLQAELGSIFGQTQIRRPAIITSSIQESLRMLSEAKLRNPWHMNWPLEVANVSAEVIDSDWYLCDAEGYALPLIKNFRHGWSLRSLGAEGSLAVFGEWNGDVFLPLSLWLDDDLIDFHALWSSK